MSTARVKRLLMSERIWTCKIGGECGELPDGSDLPMRRVVQAAFRNITGRDCEFLFSGWGATLDKFEREVVDECSKAPEKGAT